MPIVSGKVGRKFEQNRTVEIYFNGDTSVKRKFKVADELVWEILNKATGKVTIEYKKSSPFPTITNVITEMRMEIYGTGEGLRGIIKRFRKEKSKSLIDLGDVSNAGDALNFRYPRGIMLLLFLIIIIVLVAFYYIIFIPIIVAILSVFTLGESIKMIRTDVFSMKIDTINMDVCNRIREIIERTLRKKAAIKGLLEVCLERDVIDYNRRLLKAFRMFWSGIKIQYIGLLFFVTFYLVNKYLYPLGQPLFLYTEIVLGIFFFIGFFLSLAGSWKRRLSKYPNTEKFN